MRAPYRGKFDPDRDFTVRRETVIGGVKFRPGDIFDKTLVTTRRLRVFYDRRIILYPGETPGAILPPKAEAPADEFPDRTAITIPEDWQTLPWPQRAKLAASVTDEKVKKGEDAAAAIEAELARRAQLT